MTSLTRGVGNCKQCASVKVSRNLAELQKSASIPDIGFPHGVSDSELRSEESSISLALSRRTFEKSDCLGHILCANIV